MLEDVERRIAELDAEFRTIATQPTTPPPREYLVEGHLPDLGAPWRSTFRSSRVAGSGSGTIDCRTASGVIPSFVAAMRGTLGRRTMECQTKRRALMTVPEGGIQALSDAHLGPSSCTWDERIVAQGNKEAYI